MIKARITGEPFARHPFWKTTFTYDLRDTVGELSVEGIRRVLGTSEIYQLDEVYREDKLAGRTVPPMKRYEGKAEDQPLILSGAMYDGITSEKPLGQDVITVLVPPDVGIGDDGEDYVAKWQERTDFFEKGLDSVRAEEWDTALDDAFHMGSVGIWNRSENR